MDQDPPASTLNSTQHMRLTARQRNLLQVGVAYALVATTAITGYWIFKPVFADPLDEDTLFVVMGARIGLEHGWNHLYDLALQRQYYAMMAPELPFTELARYLHPPPLALLAIPLTLIPLAAAFWVGFGAQLMSLVASWWIAAPGRGLEPARTLYLLGALAWYPVLYQLRTGQPVLLIALALVLSWRLAESNRPWLAGIVLAFCTMKPQLTLWVAPCLLLAGHWRIAVAWTGTAGVLAVGSLALIGWTGLHDYIALLNFARDITFNRFFTLAYVFVTVPASTAAELVVAAFGLFAAYRMRRAPLARIFALGVVTSMLAIPYDHLHDFAILVPAAFLFLRTDPPSWQRAWLVVVWLTFEFAWPLHPLPMLIAQAGWLLMLAFPLVSRRPASRPAGVETSPAEGRLGANRLLAVFSP